MPVNDFCSNAEKTRERKENVEMHCGNAIPVQNEWVFSHSRTGLISHTVFTIKSDSGQQLQLRNIIAYFFSLLVSHCNSKAELVIKKKRDLFKYKTANFALFHDSFVVAME